MYQALYRKWRPRTFDDVVGQEQVTETLKNQVANDRLSHAYLFVGTRGTGKTSCAKILARAVNCENPVNGNPCNKCKSCLGIESGSIMDVVELDAASNNGVDNVRALRDEAVFSPAIVKKRVYIIDEVHMLSTAAFNALLKIFEEPPEHLMFILATTELHKVLPTILSRCQRYSFKRIDPDSMAKRIAYVAQQESMKLEPDAATLLARLADGSLRDGMSLLDQCSGREIITAESVLDSIGLSGNLRIGELLRKICQGDTQSALTAFSALWRDGKAPGTVLTELSALLRDILMTKVAPQGGKELLSGGFEPKILQEFAGTMTAEQIIANIDAIQSKVGSLRDGRDPKTTAELCIVGMCQPDLGDNLEQLRARVARLESGVKISAPIQEIAETEVVYAPHHIRKESAISGDEPPFDVEPAQQPLKKWVPPVQKEKAVHTPAEELAVEPVDEPHEAVQDPKTSDADSDSDLWNSIIAALKDTLPVFLQVHLKDSRGELKDNSFTIFVNNAFKKKQLESVGSQECIRNAITKVVGRPVPFKIVEEKDSPRSSAGSLDELSKFGNVKFE